MCEYSLHAVQTRPARIGDVLRITAFRGTATRGLCDEHGPREIAVCLKPGTELCFASPLLVRRASSLLSWWLGPHVYAARTATFRKVNEDNPARHHDALELNTGAVVMISSLVEGQTMTVLQVPVEVVPGPVIAAHWPITGGEREQELAA